MDLLDVVRLSATNESNRLSVEKINKKTALVTLDYLGTNDGGVLQILHTGTSSEDINFGGTIIDSELRYIKPSSTYDDMTIHTWLTFITFNFSLVALTLLTTIKNPSLYQFIYGLPQSAFVLPLLMIFIVTFVARAFIPKRKSLPDKLRAFISD